METAAISSIDSVTVLLGGAVVLMVFGAVTAIVLSRRVLLRRTGRRRLVAVILLLLGYAAVGVAFYTAFLSLGLKVNLDAILENFR